MKTGISVLLVHLFIVGSVIADERGQPLQKEMIVQMRHPEEMKIEEHWVVRGGVKVTAHGEGDHWNLPSGSAVKVNFKIRGLSADKLKGKKVALQVALGSTQKVLLWINPSKQDLDKGEMDVSYGATLKHSGRWGIRCGLVDPTNQEWWLCSSSLYSVKE